jgi:hypothetical protein
MSRPLMPSFKVATSSAESWRWSSSLKVPCCMTASVLGKPRRLPTERSALAAKVCPLGSELVARA